ncbi:glycosyltransferase family 2 protein [Mesorhizobium shangrilense]|uniref:Glycosyltransferase family 2 protein n=1 Tax=Mesorhizobium shangrilense TaxID=460060 RepID=A0ABV2DD59_9HYPH
MQEIHAIILTYNEEKHIERCIRSIDSHCTSITVVDCGSTDRTVDIARRLGASVIGNDWVNHATQVNFAIDHLSNLPGWLLRIDADEVLETPPEPLAVLAERVASDVDGILIRRRIYFLGSAIKRGGIEPSWQLRLWRNGRGRCEQRWMDEHIVVEGLTQKSDVVISDINLNSLTWWTEKHNAYASREAIDILARSHGFSGMDNRQERGGRLALQARAKRFIKNSVYLRMPTGLRSALYFLYRYIVRLGFLDGRAGFYFHVLQGFWYRTLVDAKVSEIISESATEGVSIVEAIKRKTGIDPLSGQRTGGGQAGEGRRLKS